jgi:hypothetical protein
MRHYTLDNVRWLSRSDNMAKKPSNGQDKSSLIKSSKDVVKILKACERSGCSHERIWSSLGVKPDGLRQPKNKR